MIGFDEAAAIVAEAGRPLGVETVSLDHAAGRVLAADVVARIDSPRRDVSAMDGYAVREAELPARLRVVGESFAGQAQRLQVGAGECARIFTGAALPPGTDRVVIQEVVRREGEWAIFEQPIGPARHIRKQGSDFRSGDRLLGAGTWLNPRALVAAAAADSATVEVWRRPTFTVIGTGDELAEPGTARDRPAAIPESVSFGVAALSEQWGGTCVGRVRLPDEPARLEAAAADALGKADLVVVTGGASVGEKDFAKSMFGAGLELLFSKVAIKPGKPVWLGRAAGKLVLGLPGNPTSAMVTARLFLAPLIAGMSGLEPALRWKQARLAAPLPACGDRETFHRARRSADLVELLGFQDSGAQLALAQADVLIRQLPNTPAVQAGEEVPVLDF
jgi:molybdopterin molybdotransferase